MYKDVISYQLAENISEEDLLNVAKEIIENWMSKQPGFIKWEIHKSSENGYTDIVYWESKEDAKKSEEDMINNPNFTDWYSCYKEGSITSINLSQIASFSK